MSKLVLNWPRLVADQKAESKPEEIFNAAFVLMTQQLLTLGAYLRAGNLLAAADTAFESCKREFIHPAAANVPLVQSWCQILHIVRLINTC